MKDIFKSRRILVMTVILFMFSILLFRLFYVQVMAEEYKQFAENLSRKENPLWPSRGLIYDRNGELLVSNEPVYHLQVNASKTGVFDTMLLCNILGIDKEYVKKKLIWAKSSVFRRYKDQDFYNLMSAEQYAQFQERRFDLRGFVAQPRTQRKYHHPIAPHVFGYLGEVNEKEMDAAQDYYLLGEQIGKDGLEKQYETKLRGKKGKEFIMVDNYNRKLGQYFDGELDELPEPGFVLHTSLDHELQLYGEQLLANKLGSLIALDPRTGEILALVSSVSYDPALLVGRKRLENYPTLSTDKNKPMYNRAVAGTYAPGSTFKPLMALIGLQEKVIHPGSTFSCKMGYHMRGLSVGCHAHRNHLNLKESIAQSCNAYYCNVFRLVIDQPRYKTTEKGFSVWYDYLSQFGLGQKGGIDIPGEKSGILPSVELYDKIYPKGSWRSSYVISLAIGQGEITTTPLQMANFTAALANRGFYYPPHLVTKVSYGDSISTVEYQKREISIDQKHFETVVEGLEEVFISGTARWYKIPDIDMCGKTGTAENPHGEDHSNFIAFAPKDNPVIAIAVVVENAGFGSTWAAPMASLMIEKHLTDSISKPWIEEKMLLKDFIHEVDSTDLEADLEIEGE